MIRYLTAGESHGPALTVIVEGLPAGIPVSTKRIADELARRRLGFGRGPRMKIERDALELLGGVRFGRTLGSPVSIVIRNSEWAKWERVMSPEGQPAGNVLTGTSKLYQANGRRPYHAVNYVTIHDGFTLYDLVSYDQKVNDCSPLNPILMK